MFARLRHRVAILARMPGSRRALLAEAAGLLLVARLWLLVTPFRKVAPRLGNLAPRDDAARPATADGDAARAIGWAVRLAARRVPFRAMCLQQAVAAKWMLRRRGIGSTLRLGVEHGAAERPGLRAHAWLDVAEVRVTGYPVPPTFVEICRFD